MVRISDARMSGTSYGTVVLHVAPESAAGGPLALVRDGDEIELDVPKRTLTLRVSDEELARRRARVDAAARRTSRAATAGCSSITCSRPTRAATSTSCAAARRCGGGHRPAA